MKFLFQKKKRNIEPKIAIIVISHRSEFLNQCIESIERQTYLNIEVLVHHTLKEPHVQMIENGKINRLVDACDSQYVVWLCEDDELEPTFCEKTINALLENNADLVYTDRATIGQQVQFFESGSFTKEAFNNSLVSPIPATILVKKYWWKFVGGFNAPVYSDWHFVRSLCEVGAIGYHLTEPLFLYRLHMENQTRNDDHVELLTKYFEHYPNYARRLDPSKLEDGVQKDRMIAVLNNVYGENKWQLPKPVLSLMEPQKQIQL